MLEFKILNSVVTCMESTGSTNEQVRITIDNDLLEEINVQSKDIYSLDEILAAADKCLANRWLEYSFLGSGKYSDLRITSSGLEALRLRQEVESNLESQTSLQKASSVVESYNGIFIFLGFIIAASALLLQVYSA